MEVRRRSVDSVEEGIPHKTDILRLSAAEFKIRSNNPGQPVETTFVPARIVADDSRSVACGIPNGLRVPRFTTGVFGHTAFLRELNGKGNRMITLKSGESAPLSGTLFLSMYLCLFALSAPDLAQTATVKNAVNQDIKAFFKGTRKTVLTFVGYSGAGTRMTLCCANTRRSFSANLTRSKPS